MEAGFVNGLLLWCFQADWFRQFQYSRCEGLKAQLWSHWMPKSVDVFRRLPPVFINDDADAYYR